MSECLPDPRGFDPVRFPGVPEGEVWPPPSFDFAAARLRSPGLSFERNEAGAVGLVHRLDHMTMVVDIEDAPQTLDVAPGTRDYLLLRLVPPALRYVDRIEPGDAVPAPLRDDEQSPPEDEHLHQATALLVQRLAATSGDEGLALANALRRVPPSPTMLETAVARCITEDGIALGTIAPLARRLQRLAIAHARVLSIARSQPDYASMETIIDFTREAIAAERSGRTDLLYHAIRMLKPKITRPRRTAEALLAAAVAAMRAPERLEAPTQLITQQTQYLNRLLELAGFWRRLTAAWIAVEPATTDRREIAALVRNTMRRLELEDLYRLDNLNP